MKGELVFMKKIVFVLLFIMSIASTSLAAEESNSFYCDGVIELEKELSEVRKNDELTVTVIKKDAEWLNNSYWKNNNESDIGLL